MSGAHAHSILCSPYIYIWYFLVRLCIVQSCGLDSLADTAWITCPQRRPRQGAPGECGELGGTRASSADVRGSDPVESFGTECVVVPWEDLVDLYGRVCQSSDASQQCAWMWYNSSGALDSQKPTELYWGSQISPEMSLLTKPQSSMKLDFWNCCAGFQFS